MMTARPFDNREIIGGYLITSLDQLRAEVRRYRPVEVLQLSRWLAMRLRDEPTHLYEFPIPREIDPAGRVGRVALNAAALLARLSLVEGSSLAIESLDRHGALRLFGLIAGLYEPDEPVTLLINTWDEQAWYQRDLGHAFGRGLMWYREIPRMLDDPKIDIPTAFEAHLGMSVDDFFGLAFLIYSIVSSPAQTPYQYLTTLRPGVLGQRVQDLVRPEALTKLVDAMSVDQDGYRRLAAAHNFVSSGTGRYDFDPLRVRPIINIKGSGQIVPIPDLLVWFVDEQPYRLLRAAFRGNGRSNPFADFFGKEIFERYVGLLAAEQMPTARVISERETEYGGGRSGPDWIIVQGTVGIAIEVVIAEVSQTPRGGELAALNKVIADSIAPRASKVPEKIEGLLRSRPDLRLDAVERWYRLVVTKSPLPWPAYMKPKLVDPVVAEHAQPFHLLGIEEFESLLASESEYGVTNVLREAEQTEDSADFRTLLHRIYQRDNHPFYFGRLNALRDDLLQQFGL